MKTLVYGEWHDRTKNIVPFFTASYSEKDLLPIEPRTLKTGDIIKLMFVGALESGKNPIDSLLIAHELIKRNVAIEIHFYGEGSLRDSLEKKIITLNMQHNAFVHGNVNSATLKDAYRDSHFMVLLSDSEGWPKAVAEAMWWGCVPVTTQVSCVPWMLANESRGVIVHPNNPNPTDKLVSLITNTNAYDTMTTNAMNWSRMYTLEKFEREIQDLIR
jgi:glycosyltransferase involved in cell wall biosynthesis